MSDKGAKGLSVKKSENFSEWYSEILQKAELVDLRYNVKGFLVFQPWSVLVIEKLYKEFERVLQSKGHKPYYFPTLIPESNLKKESQHLKGFTPQVFWVTHGGETELEEKLALRPTSETAFYQMFSLWLRSYKQLPFKTYQRANVFRYETKATRPLLRTREFHWIETHCLFPNEEEALAQVKEDMQITEEIMHELCGLPFIFFERPAWDKFPGASRTFAADVLNPDGKLVQQPSTHMISQDFLKGFGVTFKDKDGKDKTPFSTCYGPAMSRILASVIIVHGDDKGLRFPWDIAPLHVAIVPISDKAEKKALEIKKMIESYGASVEIDISEKSPGEKFNYWEMKGACVRIDIGDNELKSRKLSVFRRDLNKKELISEKELMKYVDKVRKECGNNLRKEADKLFEGRVKNAGNLKDIKKFVEAGNIVRCGFCSVGRDGFECAERVEKEAGAEVRGRKLEKEKASGNCVVCGHKAHEVVYIGRSY
ncbi:MAG TPA: proline--tRNA ligase [Candidatus Nanoarchaeia archaeon]|nr:proline--tRNA ligase [Candidatus Nanoarchaeia archaeon]